MPRNCGDVFIDFLQFQFLQSKAASRNNLTKESPHFQKVQENIFHWYALGAGDPQANVWRAWAAWGGERDIYIYIFFLDRDREEKKRTERTEIERERGNQTPDTHTHTHSASSPIPHRFPWMLVFSTSSLESPHNLECLRESMGPSVDRSHRKMVRTEERPKWATRCSDRGEWCGQSQLLALGCGMGRCRDWGGQTW